MHPDTHLTLQRLHSTELLRQAAEFRLARTTRAPRAPHRTLRTQLGWGLVELGLRVLPDRHVLATSSPRAV
ncbi:hypothetical protein [Streptomyces sp. NPDC051286]|uniref:hypothetical protein n=1 Tax=Streptomyces sp. NPDC051286 TaxID=3365647 RepID=UPI00378F7897